MKYQVTAIKNRLNASISIPASKSISNRVLIIHALCQHAGRVHHLSDSDDTRILHQALTLRESRIDIGHAGTAMRFLTAFLAQTTGEWELTGSDRMKQRPVKILVEALKCLGAQIDYLEEEGFPPLRITGSELTGTTLELDGSISSQYISALLMIAPVLKNGLVIQLTGRVTSRAYIEMTLRLMSRFGIHTEWKGDIIRIKEQSYNPQEFTVEADWSGASYWYQMLALAGEGQVFLSNLHLESLQGDSQIAGWFELFGIHSEQAKGGIRISKHSPVIPSRLVLDFIENPDIAQTMACLCVALKIPFHFSGLKTLKIKETDRIAALRSELAKFGAGLTEPGDGELAWNGVLIALERGKIPVIHTYHDHRMALAFAPLALTGSPLIVDDPMVVTKSYPAYWEHLEKAGFRITPV